MIKIVVLEGLPASGKSFWARAFIDDSSLNGENWVNICRDDIRAQMSEKNEKLVKNIRNKMVEDAIIEGNNIVLSDTNFMNKNYEYALELKNSIKTPIEVELKQFFTPLVVCIDRDANRENPVGAKVIRRMWNMYFKKVYEKEATKHHYKPTCERSCILVDIDGSVAQMVNRRPFEWHRVGEDIIRDDVWDIIHYYLFEQPHIRLIFMSGRDSVCREQTRLWLCKKLNLYHEPMLLMRPEGDNRPDEIVKRELFDNNIFNGSSAVAWFPYHFVGTMKVILTFLILPAASG